MEIYNWVNQIQILEGDSTPASELKRIAETKNDEDAFYVCDVSDLIRKYRNWKAKLPRVEPYYAVKCNDSPGVLRTLSLLGTGFDCATNLEIDKVLATGAKPDRIVFAHTTKPPSHITHASEVGVTRMTFDNPHELLKIKKLYPNAKMIIRIKCDAAKAKHILGDKFGCNHITEAPELLRLAKVLNIDVIGVSFHVGSGCPEKDAYRNALKAARLVFDYAETLGFNFRFLDIGGGFPGETGTSIDEVANVVNNALEEFFPNPAIRVIAEPGRYFVSSAYKMACNIHSLKHLAREDPVTGNKTEHRMYYVNEGVFESFLDVVLDSVIVTPIPLKQYNGVQYYPSTIWGQTCDSLDRIVKEVMLPEMQLGDWLMFEDMGAYTQVLSTSFNSFPAPRERFVATEKDWLLLKDRLYSRRNSTDNFKRIEKAALTKRKTVEKLYNPFANYIMRFINTVITL